MGTKLNPGEFDCYFNAEPDEPMFILLARDKHAPSKVLAWAREREDEGEKPEVVAEARKCAYDMMQWRVSHRGGKRP